MIKAYNARDGEERTLEIQGKEQVIREKAHS